MQNKAAETTLKRLHAVCAGSNSEIYISDKVATMIAGPKLRNEILTEHKGEIWGLKVTPRNQEDNDDPSNKYKLTWTKVQRTLVWDANGDVWEDKGKYEESQKEGSTDQPARGSKEPMGSSGSGGKDDTEPERKRAKK